MTTKRVEDYVAAHPNWAAEITILREQLASLPFEETIKWGMPTYCVNGKNVVSIGAFKHHLALWFHNGADLADPDEVLVNAQPGKTKSMRHMRFGPTDRVPKGRVKRYLKAALADAKRR